MAQQSFDWKTFWKVVAYGAGGSLIASIVWYFVVTLSKYQLGLVAIFVGYAVGWMVFIAKGEKRAPYAPIVSSVVTLIGLALSEIYIARYFLNQYLSAQGLVVPGLISPDLMFELLFDSIKSDPLTLLFWAIALYGAWTMASRSRENVAQEKAAAPAHGPATQAQKFVHKAKK